MVSAVVPGLQTILGEFADVIAAHPLLISAGAIVLAVVGIGTADWQGRRRHRRASAGAARVQILPGPRVDPTGAAEFWQHLLGLLPPRHRRRHGGHVVFEYTFTAAGLSLSVWVPATLSVGIVAAAARSAWPGSRTTVEPAGAQAVPAHAEAAHAEGGAMRLARPAGLPIRTDHRTDPLRALIGAVGPLRPEHQAVVQVLARPLSGARFAAATRTRSGGRTGGRLLVSVASAAAAGIAELAQELIELVVHGPAHRTRPTRTRPRLASGAGRGAARLVESAQDRAVADKTAGGGGYRTAIRYLTTAVPTDPGPAAARAAAQGSRARAHAIAAAFAEYSGHNHYRRARLRRPARTLAGRRLRRGDILSVPELAALAHLPTDEHVPGLRRAGAAAVAPPPQIPAPDDSSVRLLGDSDAVPGRAVGLTVADARHHLWIIGATGAGKSTLCVHGVLADAHAGRAAVVLDPKGDLVSNIAARLPEHARARTVLLDPDQPLADGRWPCLNPLDPLHTGHPVGGGAGGDVAVENLVSVFSRVFSSGWGHRTEDLLRVGALTLRAAPGPASLSDLTVLLTDPAARRDVVARLRPDSRLRQFWTWFDQIPDSSRAQVSAPLLNKLRAILLRPFAEKLLCGPSTVDLPRLLDTGGILLVRLPKGVLGEDTVRLIGSLLVSQVWQATLRRATQPEHHRRDASLLLDECHNFLHLPYPIEDMLAEARGFRLSVTLAHQHLAQLTPALRDGIATNARSKILFAVSPEDANTLARHTLPELGAHDLAHLDGFHAAARLMAGTGEARAFTLTTRPLPPSPQRRREPGTPCGATPPGAPPTGESRDRRPGDRPVARPHPIGLPRNDPRRS